MAKKFERKGLIKMTLTMERAFLNEVEYTEEQFAKYFKEVFGTWGTFSYANSGLVLSIISGGMLIDGQFYTLSGNEDITLPANATSYIIASQPIADRTAPITFSVSNTIAEDTTEQLQASVFRCITTADSIRVIDRIGGNATALYRSLYQRVDNLSTVYSGTTDPANTLGNDGDVYIKYI